jgi:hypothetical protein
MIHRALRHHRAGSPQLEAWAVAKAISKQKARDAHKQRAARTAREQRGIQRKLDKAKVKSGNRAATRRRAVQAGERREPTSFHERRLPKPGRQHRLDPVPNADAPCCEGNNKLRGKVALIIGGDSGIGSAIVNTGSETGLFGSGALLDYSATKGAIHAFTRAPAKNLLPRGIRVNAVAPGPVWTPLNPADRPAREVFKFGRESAMGQTAQPEELALPYVFLAAPACSSCISGSVLEVLGGPTG